MQQVSKRISLHCQTIVERAWWPLVLRALEADPVPSDATLSTRTKSGVSSVQRMSSKPNPSNHTRVQAPKPPWPRPARHHVSSTDAQPFVNHRTTSFFPPGPGRPLELSQPNSAIGLSSNSVWSAPKLKPLYHFPFPAATTS